MGMLEAKLNEMGHRLPPPFIYPKASRCGGVKVGNMLFLSGHGVSAASFPGLRLTGKLGSDMTTDEGYAAARAVALSMLASLKRALGDLDHVKQVVRLFGMVNSAPTFAQQSLVIDGASDLFFELFGPKAGCHARSAVGMAALPHGMAVEINGEFEIVP
jgi:enamine deaminase RidA (YjgF/YER057c/UK114 family)